MINDVVVRYFCDDALAAVGDKEIARYCYEKGMMTKEQALEVIGDEEELTKHRINCNVYVDGDDVLEEIDTDDLYEWLKEDGYNFPYNKPNSDYDKYSFITMVKDRFSQIYTRVYDKEDFKKEICKVIDDYLV